MTRFEAERHARRNAEQVTRDALLKRNQAESDRDLARAQRDALLAALKLCEAALTPSRNGRDLIAADEAREVIARAEGAT